MPKEINYKKLIKDFLTVIFFIFLSLIFCIYIELFITNNFKYFLYLLCALSFGFWFHAFHLFFHEATHYKLHSNKKINDFLSDLLFVPTIGLKTKNYRKYHWQHHKNLGKINDTENSYFTALSIRNIFKSLIPIFSIAEKIKNDKKILSNDDFKLFEPHILIFAVVFHGSIASIMYTFNLKYSSLVYTLSILIIFPTFAKIRQKLEHRDEKAIADTDYSSVNHGEYNRIFSDNFFSRFFGAAGFNKHYLHHLNPTISYTNFNEFESYIKKNDENLYNKIINSKTTYLETFLKLIKY